MVTKKKSTAKKERVKVRNLELNRETVKNLSGSDKKQIKGGALPTTSKAAISCAGCAKL